MRKNHNPQRRDFLRTLGAGTAAAGAAAAIGHVTFAQADSPKTTDTETNENYRETEHVRAFYASLRD